MLDRKAILVFKNDEGKEIQLLTTVKLMLENTLEDFYEELEYECTSASCNTESQNFCDCSTVYDDYVIDDVII